jgi:hypothetical protein
MPGWRVETNGWYEAQGRTLANIPSVLRSVTSMISGPMPSP